MLIPGTTYIGTPQLCLNTSYVNVNLEERKEKHFGSIRLNTSYVNVNQHFSAPVTDI